MLIPKKIKHRKWHKVSGSGRAKKACRMVKLDYGEFGLKAVTEAWVNSRQIEAARRAMTRYIKRGGKVWIRIFPDKPVTQKGSQSTMGGGKGSPEYYVISVRPGNIIFEMAGVDRATASEAMRLAATKLPVLTRFISK